MREAPDTSAVLVTAPVAGPFQDADLFRVAWLVRQYGQHRWVEVAFGGGDPDLPEGLERCRRLGQAHIALVRAAFAAPAVLPAGVLDTGPLLSRAAIDQVVRARAQEALHRLSHGQDGIARAWTPSTGTGTRTRTARAPITTTPTHRARTTATPTAPAIPAGTATRTAIPPTDPKEGKYHHVRWRQLPLRRRLRRDQRRPPQGQGHRLQHR